MVTNPVWIDVLNSFRILWKSNFALERSVIMETPIWLNPSFKLHNRRGWKEKGIMIISDFIDHLKTPYSMGNFIAKYEVKTNFLEHARISALINEYLH